LTETLSRFVANCPNPDCKASILESEPYPWCTECGERLPEELQSQLPRIREGRTKAAAALANLEKQDVRDAGPVEVLGRPLFCTICRHDHFFRQEVDLDVVAGAVLLGISLGAASGTYLVCAACGYVHWFRWLNEGKT